MQCCMCEKKIQEFWMFKLKTKLNGIPMSYLFCEIQCINDWTKHIAENRRRKLTSSFSEIRQDKDIIEELRYYKHLCLAHEATLKEMTNLFKDGQSPGKVYDEICAILKTNGFLEITE